jgi:NAD-dependent SIR2 family protein deacetylase
MLLVPSPESSPMKADFEHAAELIAGADTLIIAAGAGMGVDSGLPDFRGNDGFWRAYPALRQAQLAFTSIASPAAFRERPERAWGFYGHRLALYRKTVPNPGFAMLKRWGERMPNGVGIFTSNVDGQFQKAGFGADSIEECHGSIHHLQCMGPCTEAIWGADGLLPEVDEVQCTLTSALPACPHCGGLARPNILMFGDGEWIADRTEAQATRLMGRCLRGPMRRWPAAAWKRYWRSTPSCKKATLRVAFSGSVQRYRFGKQPAREGNAETAARSRVRQ